MAKISFGNNPADMRLETSWYGIDALQPIADYLWNFVPTSFQTLTATSTTVRVIERNSAGESVTVTLTGNIPAYEASSAEFIANGIKFRYTGNFHIGAYDIDGNATSVSASYANSGALIASIDHINSWISATLNAGQPLQEGLGYFLAGNDSITGGTGSDYLLGYEGADTLTGGGGTDTLVGGTGNDTYFVDSNTDVIIEDSEEYNVEDRDTVKASFSYRLSTNLEHLTLLGSGNLSGIGNTLANRIIGNGGANKLIGNAGNDTLNGGKGIDTLIGGSGNDVYVVDNAHDVLNEGSNAGMDRVLSAVSYTLSDQIEQLTLQGTAAINGTGNTLNNTLTGNTGNNHLYGLAGNDSLYGGDGNDTLNGGTGNDTLNGGTGDNLLYGGNGDDVYIVKSTAEQLIENSNAGTDKVLSTTSYTLPPQIEHLTLQGTAAINGSGNSLNNNLTGNAGNNHLYGLAGNDTLDGGKGNDSLYGGDGNDVYIVNSVSDRIIENANQGNDLVRASFNYTLGNNLENLSLTGTGNLNGTGNALDNTIRGNSGRNMLIGGSGNDYLDGGAGADSLSGGEGNDTLVASGSADTLVGGSGDDVYVFSLKTSEAIGYQGTLELDTGATVDLNTGDVSFNLNDYTGDGKTDYLSLHFWPTDYPTPWFDLDLATNHLSQNLAVGTYTDAQRSQYVENGHPELYFAYNGYEPYFLSGSFTIRTLDIDYSGTSPTLTNLDASFSIPGFSGSISYALDIAPTITELADGGNDTVQSLYSCTLSDNVENLVLTGAYIANGTGNAQDNSLTGNDSSNHLAGLDGADTLQGKAGNDTLTGGAGSDTLTGGLGADSFVFTAASESDGASSQDVIADFAAGDRIDLAAIDADTLTDGDQAFVFGSGPTFSGSFAGQGELFFDQTTGKLYGNNDDDSAADFAIQIHLVGISTLTAENLTL